MQITRKIGYSFLTVLGRELFDRIVHHVVQPHCSQSMFKNYTADSCSPLCSSEVVDDAVAAMSESLRDHTCYHERVMTKMTRFSSEMMPWIVHN